MKFFMAKLGRVHAQLVGHDVRHALDGMHSLGDAERAAVGDAARRLVGVAPSTSTKACLKLYEPVQTWKRPAGNLDGLAAASV